MPGRVRVHLVALAAAYQAAGRTAEAIPLSEQTLADRERVLTLDHFSTRPCNNLAAAYRAGGVTSMLKPWGPT